MAGHFTVPREWSPWI